MTLLDLYIELLKAGYFKNVNFPGKMSLEEAIAQRNNLTK